MDFLRVIADVVSRMDGAGIRYALIGGFAMGLHGLQRATMDMDFILLLEDLDRADAILQAAGFRRCFRNQNVSHYQADDAALGRIDLIHAFRGPSRAMLGRAERLQVTAGLSLPVARAEDIIGLKIQAAVNDPQRHARDWTDIRMLLETAAENVAPVDWTLILSYLEIFGLHERLGEMKDWYAAIRQK